RSACLLLDRRPALDGLLRAHFMEHAAGHAKQQWPEDVFHAARRRILETPQLRGTFFLLLHRHRSGGIREIHRHHLLPRWRWRLCEPVSSFRTALAREKNSAAPGDSVPV